ncbi:MAG: alpha/beta hydrolase [Candidatus Nealsonbacteria bacterium]|nr:alpha/beta hydrolase [Candidatus Nealsonbacteria bacterium]
MEKKEQKIQVNGLNINYKIIGEGKPFLILHGWGSKSDRWTEVADILSQKGFKVVIPDLPGFGKSDGPKNAWNLDNYVEFVEKFAEIIGLDKFILAGHSFSGAISIKYAIKNPGDIEKLFLLAPACLRRDSFRKKAFRIISKLFKVYSFIPGYKLARKAFYKFIIRKSDYQYTNGTMKETYLKIISEDLSGILNEVKADTIIIWGDEDDIVPIGQGKEINRKISGSKLIIIPGADHKLEIKTPEALASKILENIVG